MTIRHIDFNDDVLIGCEQQYEQGCCMPGVTTVAKLRVRLGEFFARTTIDTVLRRLREAGTLPAGSPGHGGVGSAALNVEQVAMVLIALAVQAAPIDVPEEAKRLADYRLRAIDRTGSSEPNPRRRHLDGLSSWTFLKALTAEIEFARGACPEEVRGWVIEGHEAAQAHPERLVFVGLPRGDAVRRATFVPAYLIRRVAELFPPIERAEHDLELEARLAQALAL